MLNEVPEPGFGEVAHSTWKREASIMSSNLSPVLSFRLKVMVVTPPLYGKKEEKVGHSLPGRKTKTSKKGKSAFFFQSPIIIKIFVLVGLFLS